MPSSFAVFVKSALVALFMLLAGASMAQQVTFPKDDLSIQTVAGKTIKFSVELALTDRQREQGLMYRKEMAPDHGMLFDFDQPRRVTMWMQNTILPLDMLFIQPDGKVSHIQENAVPYSQAIIDSMGPVKYVLELNAGRVQALGLKVGDKVINKRIGNGG